MEMDMINHPLPTVYSISVAPLHRCIVDLNVMLKRATAKCTATYQLILPSQHTQARHVARMM